jgi:S1-C subfamily serine protease
VYASAAPSVVSVADYKLVNGNEVPEGIGTGFVWDSYGHVVTNYHCVSKFILDTTGKQVSKGGQQQHIYL